MLHDKTKRLIDRISAATEEGALDWSEAAAKNTFAFEADGYQISLEVAGATVALIIADADGRELETLSEDELSASADARGRDYETIMRDVYARARRSALGTDEAIDRIMAAMDAEEGEGESARGWR